jgi:ankyrin repeat protein
LLQISRARASIEQFSVVPFFENRELFLSAYGIAVYKCPILTCPHFGNGFTTRNLRDAHYQRHERLFKCEHEECDYSAFGFPTKATLARHVRLCHEAWTDQPIFPKISRRPIDKALNDAIEKEDLIAVRTLAMELLDLQDAPAGFLMRSIKAGKRNCARLLIEILGETKEMDHQDSSGTTALHMLVQNADEELLSAMLATSVNVNTQRKHPSGLLYTPLQFATVSSSIAIVRLLLQHRHAKRTLTANKASVTRRSILSWAVNAGSGEILKLLLETGWEIFRDGTDILDALEIAIGSSQKTLVGTLLVWGRVLGVETRYPSPYIDWILPDLDDMVPVFMGETTIDAAWEPSKKKCEERIRNATLGGDITRMRLLLRATGVHHISCKHGTVLTIAALYGNIYTVQMLISKGEDISQTVNDGSSAFENAAAGGHEAILQLLLDNGANINEETRDLSDGTALQCAAANGHCSAVGFLLKLGAKIDRHGKGPHNSEAALIKAAGLSSEATALLLLQHGADASAKNLLGESVLHVAAKKGHEELVIQLIKSGAAVDELTAGGDTVLMFAAENGLEEATRLLLEHEVVNHQIELQGRDWIDADGYKCSSSALFRATSGGHFKVVELLLQAGAWASVANELGQTPLAVAKQNGHDFIVALLHSYGVPRGTNYSRFPTGVTFHE